MYSRCSFDPSKRVVSHDERPVAQAPSRFAPLRVIKAGRLNQFHRDSFKRTEFDFGLHAGQEFERVLLCIGVRSPFFELFIKIE
jgi:hypothetical protein